VDNENIMRGGAKNGGCWMAGLVDPVGGADQVRA